MRSSALWSPASRLALPSSLLNRRNRCFCTAGMREASALIAGKEKRQKNEVSSATASHGKCSG